jgi:DNA-binding LacI/PurR family transcriptional regulator
MEPKNPVTIFDIAEAAGVSVSTVSRILNDKPDVSEKTRQQVLRIIQELNYTPHAQARRLASGESQAVALLDPVNMKGERIIDQLHLDFMIGGADAAGAQNYFFNVQTTNINRRNHLDIYRKVQVDGVILMENFKQDRRVDLLRENGLPFLMIGRCADCNDLSYVELDIETSVQMAIRHLVQLGHRKIGLISFPKHMRDEGYGPAVYGWKGYQAALAECGIEVYLREISLTISGVAAATESLLDEAPDLTGLVVMTDASIPGTLSVLKTRGKRVPEDFSIVGLATDRLAELMQPKLTAVRFPSYEMGYQAVTILINKLRDPNFPVTQHLIAPELVVRESTALLPA